MLRSYTLVLMAAAAVLLSAGCPDKTPRYPACGEDKDCQAGQRCINKKCVECGKDGDCPEGETCRDGACVAPAAECTSDDQCAEGQVCKDGQCRACESNGECGPGGTCNQGACERPKACKADEDCDDDEDCIDGRCLKPWLGDAPEDAACELNTVYFEFDQYSVREDARDGLTALAECLQKASSAGLYVVGHADESGTEEYNIALSERRARAVADYLARLGIDPAQLRIVPKGESEPSGRGEDADRRVEFEWR